MPRILIVEDDASISDVLLFVLRNAGYRCDLAEDGSKAWLFIQEQPPDLIVLDLGLPGLPGLELLRNLRKSFPHLPVIILSARDAVSDRVCGLELGADDYVGKPFSNAELLARVQGLFRRCPQQHPEIRRGPLRLLPEHCELQIDGESLQLNLQETRLLEQLLGGTGRCFSRNQLLNSVYQEEAPALSDRSIDQLVTRLRRKLKRRSPNQEFIHTVYGVGYRLELPS